MLPENRQKAVRVNKLWFGPDNVIGLETLLSDKACGEDFQEHQKSQNVG